MTRPPPPTLPVPDSTADPAPTCGNSDAGPAPPRLGSQPEADLIDTQIFVQVLDSAVRSIFTVTLTVSAARNLTEGPVTARLDQAIDELDDLVRELRHHAMAAHRSARARREPGAEPAHPGTSRSTFAPDLVHETAGALLDVDAVLARLVTDAGAEPRDDVSSNLREHISKAGRAVRLAKDTLTTVII